MMSTEVWPLVVLFFSGIGLGIISLIGIVKEQRSADKDA